MLVLTIPTKENSIRTKRTNDGGLDRRNCQYN